MPVERLDNFLCQGLARAFGAGVRLQDDEFIAAEAGDAVGVTRFGEQPFANLHQQSITGRMTHQIVKVLEKVEVHIEHRKGFTASLRILERGSQSLMKRPAIGKASEGVRACQLADQLIGFEQFAGVAVRPPHKGKDHPGEA